METFGTELNIGDFMKTGLQICFQWTAKNAQYLNPCTLDCKNGCKSAKFVFQFVSMIYSFPVLTIVRSLVYECFHFYKCARFVRMSFETSKETFD